MFFHTVITRVKLPSTYVYYSYVSHTDRTTLV